MNIEARDTYLHLISNEMLGTIFVFSGLATVDREKFVKFFPSLKDFNLKTVNLLSYKEIVHLHHAELAALDSLDTKMGEFQKNLRAHNLRVQKASIASQDSTFRAIIRVFTGPNETEKELAAARKAYKIALREEERLDLAHIQTRSALCAIVERRATKDDLDANKLAFHEITKLFGGLEKFFEFAVLDLRSLPLSEATLLEDTIDYIDSDHINAPVMRGKNIQGRRFVVLRLQAKGFSRYVDEPICFTLFETSRVGKNWKTAGPNNSFSSFIILDGVKQESYTKLQNVLQGRDPIWENS